MAITEKNILNNWFRTGAKPTREQFWNWQDSYWHKDEKIPMQNIEGIDTALENKAETTAVDAKANADASDLGDENVAKWKEMLGVGEVPDNIAKIDTDSEQGNVYDKTQVDDLLENSGKNIGNSDLKVPEGEVRVIDFTGAKFQTKGLENKRNDLSFNLKPILDANGEWAVSDEPDVRFNLPDRVGFTAPPTTLNITVNNVAPPTIMVRDQPNFSQEIQELMSDLTKNDWTDFTAEEYGSPILEDGTPRFKLDSSGFITPTTDLRSKLTFPFEKDWILKIKLYNRSPPSWEPAPVSTGLYRTETLIREYYPLVGGFHILIFIKKGNVIYRCIYTPNGNWQQAVFPLQGNLGAIGVYSLAFRQKISYKILN